MSAVPPKPIIYLDSNIVIYFVEGRSPFRESAEAVVAGAQALGNRLMTSELTVAECLYRPYKDRDTRKIEFYESLFGSGALDLYPLSGALIIQAAKDGGALGLKLMDAVHYLSALEAGCDQLVTADRRFKSTRYLEVVNL
jgi:predicted nucleic acid-binding protein